MLFVLFSEPIRADVSLEFLSIGPDSAEKFISAISACF